MARGARNIVILTGSGVSAESGVATFRDKDGVWARVDFRDVATPEGFARNPSLVHDFYNARRRALPDVEPNCAHFALAELEAGLASKGGRVTLVTQNVDDLHERAGSKNLFHMHGELLKAICSHCGVVREWRDDISTQTACPDCANRQGMRPNVVWFGEMPHFLDDIGEAIASAELFVSIGTSGSVYPAAGFVSQAIENGVRATELNLEPSENAYLFTDARYGPATNIIPAWVREILDAT